MSRFRESVIVEPEPVYEPREKGGAMMPFIFGLIIGIGGLAVYLGAPGTLDAIMALYEQQVSSLSEGMQTYAPWIVIALIVIVVWFVRRILLRIPLIFGVILGAFLWFPFGNHVMALVPAVEENFPSLRAGLTETIENYRFLGTARELTEEFVPVPGTPPAE